MPLKSHEPNYFDWNIAKLQNHVPNIFHPLSLFFYILFVLIFVFWSCWVFRVIFFRSKQKTFASSSFQTFSYFEYALFLSEWWSYLHYKVKVECHTWHMTVDMSIGNIMWCCLLKILGLCNYVLRLTKSNIFIWEIGRLTHKTN